MRRISLFPGSNRSFLTGFDPIVPFAAVREVLNSVMEDRADTGESSNLGFTDFTPTLSINENKESIHVALELAGVKQEDVSIGLESEKGLLTIKGQKNKAVAEGLSNKLYSSRRFGKFEHVIKIKTPVHQDKVDAVLKDGVLEVTLSKKEQVTTSQNIPIRTH